LSQAKKQLDKQRPQTAGRKFRPKTAVAVTADWSRADAEQLRSTIAAAAQAGGALRLGCTRDGGAYSIGIYGDGPEPYTEYVRPNEDLDDFLRDLEQTFYPKENK